MSFSREWKVKAVRKEHRCQGCRTKLEIGQPAARWAGTTDGQFDSVIYHPECREAEVALNDLTGDWVYGDWHSLSEIEDDDRAWLAENHPIVARRMGIPVPYQGDPA